MQDDERCCGTGTCLIDDSGRCWCGQQWDGEKMCAPQTMASAVPATEIPTEQGTRAQHP
jgi:hypothetical protein